MTITTSTNLPPLIAQSFNHNLLRVNDAKKPQEIEEKYREAINRKFKNGSRNHKKCQELITIYEEIYGWVQAKKAYDKSENKEEEKKPSIPLEAINRLSHKQRENVRAAFVILGYATPEIRK